MPSDKPPIKPATPTGKLKAHGDENVNKVLGDLHRSVRTASADVFKGRQVRVVSMRAIREMVAKLLEQSGSSAGVQAMIEEMAKVRMEADSLNNKLVAAEQKAQESQQHIMAQEQRVTELEAEIDHLREHGDTKVRERLAQAEQSARNNTKRTDSIDEEHQYLRKSVESMRTAIATLEKELANTRRKAEDAQKSANSERERLQGKIAAGAERLKALEAQNRTLIDAMARSEAAHLSEREEHERELAHLKQQMGGRAAAPSGQARDEEAGATRRPTAKIRKTTRIIKNTTRITKGTGRVPKDS